MPFWLSLGLYGVYFAIILVCISFVLSENRNPVRALSWTIALLALPGIGLIFYLFFGRSLKGRSMISRRHKRKLMHDSHLQARHQSNGVLSPQHRQLVRLAHNLCRAPLVFNNQIEIFTDGRSKFNRLKEDLENARKSIMLQYYIFADDNLGKEIAEILKRKAKEGVLVLVIYDHVGSFSTRGRFFKDMRKAGVLVHPFFRVTFPQLANRINWRNHRKMVIIDDCIGYIGGMNIAERYVEGFPDGRKWRDTHYRLRGDIVRSLFYSFAIDWNFLKRHLSDAYRFEPPESPRSDTAIQLVTSGPVDRWDIQSLCFLRSISGAQKCIYIQTPYFLPTDALMRALETAALAKIDVRIMMPYRSDSRMLRLASFSYISQCLQAGIKVYLYRPGMLHSKVMIVDHDFVTTGSTNFDFRSLENNFECNIQVYDEDFNRQMRDIFFSDVQECTKLTLQQWLGRPWHQRMLEKLVRLCAPIL